DGPVGLMSWVIAALQRKGCGLLARRRRGKTEGSGKREAGRGKRGHAAQGGQGFNDLIVSHPEQVVSVDQGVEVDRIEIPSLRIREAGDVSRRDRRGDPFRKTPAIVVGPDLAS